MVVGLFGPTIDLGPLGALALWGIIILGVIALLGSVTLGGAIVFVLLGILGIIVLYFLTRRTKVKLEGRG
jgi:hypothetical protein